MNHTALHEHHKADHQLARDALRAVARSFRISYPIARGRFIDGDWMVTAEFWRQIHARRPGQHFVGISWCHSCRMFSFSHHLAS